MGVLIEENDQGLFKLISSDNDKPLHQEEFVTKEEAKRILIYREFWKLIENTIKIDMEFPNGYYVNNKINPWSNKFSEFYSETEKNNSKNESGEIFYSKFEEIRESLGLKFDFHFYDNEDDQIEDNLLD
jgi:hypothetical protein